ncbi:uncharacterized protein LOC129854568 isoform X2 [Salvelinus fontinalis]|uniref:uncharacterized protein LOC129854568 isoform X2 n=1 Tax=Salvelinus fontinalis TaxID=8038 RepID=UPI002484F84B|nr:uncharacterized protein LOC129854568 isoform X2 [Salvelinus fontinalis]
MSGCKHFRKLLLCSTTPPTHFHFMFKFSVGEDWEAVPVTTHEDCDDSHHQKCLSVGPVIIWFLSSLPSSQLKTVFLDILRCCVGESLSIEIPDDDQCPVSNFSVCTEKIGQVFEYSKKLSELTVDPRYQDRIQLKNDAYGLAVVIWNVTKEDEKQQYYVDCASTILKRFVIQIPRSIESSTTTAFPQPSTTTPGGLPVEHLAWLVLVPVCLSGIVLHIRNR